MPIGGTNKVGNIGKSTKKTGNIGSPKTCYGSAQTVDQDTIKLEYPVEE